MKELSINTPGVKVLRLRENHIDGIIELMNKEGWYYYDHHELKRYLNLNQDCFTLLKDGRITGSIFTTNYGNQAWIGNIIVAKEARGMGLAAKLIRRVIDYLRENKHILTFRLGAVPLAIGLYKKVGFHAEAFTTSQEAKLPIKAEYEEMNLGENIQVEKLDIHNLEAISEIDEKYFKSNRLQFLMNIFNDSIKESCFRLKDQEKIVGFLMMKRRQSSKDEGRFAEGPDYAYRLGPSCVLPEYGINGFKALFREAIRAVNKEVRQLSGSARMYVVFPKNADKEEIYKDTRELVSCIANKVKFDWSGLDGELFRNFTCMPSVCAWISGQLNAKRDQPYKAMVLRHPITTKYNADDQHRLLYFAAPVHPEYHRQIKPNLQCRTLTKAMGMDANMNLDRVFNEHGHIFGARNSIKNEEQWKYMKSLGFHQEYFEQVMSYTPGEAVNTQPAQRKAENTRSDTEGIFALATPGDKA